MVYKCSIWAQNVRLHIIEVARIYQSGTCVQAFCEVFYRHYFLQSSDKSSGVGAVHHMPEEDAEVQSGP